MNASRLIDYLGAPLRYRLMRPAHLAILVDDVVHGARRPARTDAVHLDALLAWLCRAQDRRNGKPDAGSVSAGWSFEDGWLPGYPETSGYIIETFLAAADLLRREDLRERAHRILDWELSIQNADGSFPGHFGEPGSRPVIFNTGQIIHGLLAGHQAFGRDDCLAAAARAAAWMVSSQDEDGCWRRSVHNGIPHTYNTRAAWALLRTGLVCGEQRFVAAAARNLDWALARQSASGWYADNAFTTGAAPFTHTIAYAARGLLEAGLLLEEPRYTDSAVRAATALAGTQAADGGLAGAFADGWIPRGRYCCLTGLAQTAIIWLRAAPLTAEADYLRAAERAIAYLKRHHRPGDGSKPGDGALAGSFPIWGAYSRFEYPNWAAKFFADALMLRIGVEAIPAADLRPTAAVQQAVKS